MAKTDLKFIDYFDNETTLKVARELVFSDSRPETDVVRLILFNGAQESIIDLDKSTAIKFAKTVRTEINKIKEVSNETH